MSATVKQQLQRSTDERTRAQNGTCPARGCGDTGLVGRRRGTRGPGSPVGSGQTSHHRALVLSNCTTGHRSRIKSKMGWALGTALVTQLPMHFTSLDVTEGPNHRGAQGGDGGGAVQKNLGELVPRDWLWECRWRSREKEAPTLSEQHSQPCEVGAVTSLGGLENPFLQEGVLEGVTGGVRSHSQP